MAAFLILLITAGFLKTADPALAQPDRYQGQGPIVGPPVTPGRFDGSVRDLPKVRPASPALPAREVPLGILPGEGPTQPAPETGVIDQAYSSGPLAGLAIAPPEFLNPSQNFNGIAYTQSVPPDPVGDVGPNHYFQATNSVFQIFDKQGNTLAGPTNINQLWIQQNAGNLCRNNNNGDPYVNYDHLADRWVLSQFAVPNGFGTPPTAECFAISQTADPVNGGWYLYEFQFNFGHDYPKVGVWPDGYYMSSQRGFSGGQLNLVVFDRANMLNGNPATFQAFTSPSPALIWLPSDLDGPPPPAGTPNFFSRHVDGDQWGGTDRVEVISFSVNWQDPTQSTCGVGGVAPACGAPDFSLATVPFDSNLCATGNLFDNCVPQSGTTQLLETLPHWAMGPLQYRNFGSYETLVFNHTVDVDGSGHAGIRWYELRRPSGGAWAIYQQGTHSPDAGNPGLADDVFRWMGSLAMDKAGNIALGYSVASGTVDAGIRYAGRYTSDPLGLLPQGAAPNGEVTLVNGQDAQIVNGNRWGDYSAMRVDPVDGCTFWYTNQYITNNPLVGQPTGGAWGTRIGSFRFPSCDPADLSIDKTAAPSPATAGQQLFYTIDVRNNGPDTATNVVVTDTLPAGITYVSDTDSCTETAPGSGILTCNLGDLLSGETNSFEIKTAIPPDFIAASGPRSITNLAEVASDKLDPDTTNNSATVATIVEDNADLQIVKLCKPDTTTPAGGDYVCTLIVENQGPSSARLVSLRDDVVASGDFTITSITNDPNRTDTCSPATPFGPASSATVECDLSAALEPKDSSGGGAWTIKYTITAMEPSDINNCAAVFTDASGTPDPNPANNQACEQVQVTGAADLALTKTDTPDPLDAGTTLTYTLGVTNNGPSTAVNVVVSDYLPAGVSIVSVSGTGSASCHFGVPGDSSRPTTCNFDSIASSASETMTIVVTIEIPGILPVARNDASVSSDTYDPDNSNNIASQDTTIRVADLRIQKTSDADVYKPSSTVNYLVTVRNDGPAEAGDVVVIDNLPDFKQAVFEFVDPNVCTKSGATLTCDLGDIPPGDSTSFHIYMTILGNQGQVSNSASVSSTTFDPEALNNASTRVVLIKGGINVGMAVVGSDYIHIGTVRAVGEENIQVDRGGVLPDLTVSWSDIFDVRDEMVVLKIKGGSSQDSIWIPLISFR